MIGFLDSDMRRMFSFMPGSCRAIVAGSEVRAIINSPRREKLSYTETTGGMMRSNNVVTERSITYFLDSLPVPQKNDPVIVNDAAFVVREVLHDGHGQVTLFLREAPPAPAAP
jgi:hypothetical protein